MFPTDLPEVTIDRLMLGIFANIPVEQDQLEDARLSFSVIFVLKTSGSNNRLGPP